MKKLLILFLVGFAVICLCFAKGEQESTKTQDITIAVQSTPTMDYLVSILPEFEERTGIKVTADMMPYDALVQKVTIDCTTGTKQYAAFWFEPTWLGSFEKELENIDKYIKDPILGKDFDLDDFSEIFLDQTVRYNGKTLGLPFEGCLLVLAYREDLFEQYGLVIPDTLDEHIRNARAISERGDVSGLTMMGKRGQPVFYEYMPYMYGFGGSFFDENMRPTINSKECLAALEYMIRLSKYAPSGITSFGWEESATGFLQGNTGMGFMFTDWIPALKDKSSSKVYGKWNFAAIPAGPKSQGSPVGTINLGINADCDEDVKRAAFRFINWATSKEIQKRLAVVGGTPTRKSVIEDPDFHTKDFNYFKALRDTFDISITPMKIPEFFELNDALSMELSAAVAGSKTPQQALDDAQKAWLKIMKDSGYGY